MTQTQGPGDKDELLWTEMILCPFLFGAAGIGEAGVATGEEAEARDNMSKGALAVTEEVTPQRDRTVKK